MHNSFLEKAKLLNQNNEAYAMAFIIRRLIPSSGKPGDKAIITKEGHIHGWIGGGCTRGIVLKEALLSLKEGKPRTVSISPSAKNNLPDHIKTYTMTCQSGGEVDIYIEPVLPKPHIVIFGVSHIGMALSKIAKSMDYEVSAISNKVDKNLFPDADHLIDLKEVENNSLGKNAYAVVCTQGEGDTEALFKAVEMNPSYLSFVASRKKANAIFSELRDKGLNFDQLKKIKTPAGLDIGAKLPEEVAISILAQIIQDFRSIPTVTEPQKEEPLVIDNDDFYINPVCQIPVQKSTAKHVLQYKEEKVYFCCDGCKVSFEKNPAKYMEPAK